MTEWTPSERRFLRKLNTPRKIQDHLDQLTYNCENSALSPRWVMITNEGHCFEGGLFACAALEFHGMKPLMVDLEAYNDDHHVLAVYKTNTGWGSIAKSNTALLRARAPFYQNVRELVMSYFDFYFNTKGALSLTSFAGPIDLNRYNHWNWRTTDADLEEMGMSFWKEKHVKLMTPAQIKKLPKVSKGVVDACFLGANPEGLFKA
jgi:hypothetical protein